MIDKEIEHISTITLGDVGNLEAAQRMLAIEIQGEKIQHMRDITDAVDMTVDVDVAILGHDAALGLLGGHLDALGFIDGTRLFGTSIVEQKTIVERGKVNRFSTLDANQRPGAPAIADGLTLSIADGVVTVGEKTIDFLDPSINLERLIALRQSIELDGETRQNPGVGLVVEVGHTETSRRGMLLRTVEQVVAQHAQSESSGEVGMKGFTHQRGGTNFI